MTQSRKDKVKEKLGEIGVDLSELLKDIKGYELFVYEMAVVENLQKALDLVNKSDSMIEA